MRMLIRLSVLTVALTVMTVQTQAQRTPVLRGVKAIQVRPTVVAKPEKVKEEFGAVPVGELTNVHEQFYAISNERKIKHPAIEAILSASHGGVFR